MLKKNFLIIIIFFVLLFVNNKLVADANNIDTSFVNNNNKFAFDIFSHADNNDKNSVLSPYSISTAFVMAYAGAEKQTKKQISDVFYFDMNEKKALKNFKNLDIEIESSNNKIDIFTANALWIDVNWHFRNEYLQSCKVFNNAETYSVNLKNKKECSNKINEWVSKKTKNKITEIITPDDLQLARLVITNAIYFNVLWQNNFDEKQTKNAKFYLTNDKSIDVKMMGNNEKLNYYEDNKVQIVEIPYNGKSISMLIILPKSSMDISSDKKLFNITNYNKWNKNISEKKVQIYLPKFKIASSFDLNNTLIDMGMPLAFSKEADFSKITGTNDLRIDKVKHKCFVEVDEKGTEAAATTAIVMVEKCAARNIIFKANHAFVFIIKDNNTNSILFIGKVVNPNLQ